ncbi:unnamed protein product (macronuclear) [Paramecium tetraurelia]|uniref:EF-hand domain-containing protein n=1 Tax=Paramecium tetraurelia TaxID=5888 RepID=A0CNS3_PARTE|nr:uncharacterized protein GSPATT00008882001 [Paramecium tetraurelia]CAK72440.1 unnamed protein product [Paramecium tetraurelia]|eukprot:XP_001439837.1 hypothetical protein (macronuclear) [Paramecium tetraurelia strain d4-2]
MIFTPASQQEKATLEKIGEFLMGLSKNVLKQGSSISLPKFLQDLELTSNELCYMLQARDQNDYSQAINKYTQVWKDVLKSVQINNQMHTEGEQELEPLSRADIMQRMKKKLMEGGQTGRLGGARVGGFQSPLAENERIKNRQLSSKNSNILPSIRLNSFEQQTDRTLNNSSRVQYELDDNQKCILNEVLKQSNKLNVQIVMKRYDPKIKLCISQGTDTNLDILEVMRNFKKEYHESKLQEIVQDSDKHSMELQKFLNERIDYRYTLQTQQVTDKLKGVHKQMIQKSMDIETVILDTQKQQIQQDMIPDILNDFIDYVNESYQNVQHETYKVMMKFVSGFLVRRLKQDSEKKLPQQNSQQLLSGSNKDRKAPPIRRADNSEQLQKELSNKNVELDKKFMENAELWNKVRLMENQIMQMNIEIESTKIAEKAIEQERTQLLYEKQKLEKQLSVITSKTFQDQAVQVSDQSLQQQISKLQKENQELQQRLYQLTGELNKKKSIPADQRSLQMDIANSQDQSNKDSPKGTGKIKSQFDFAPDEDNVSIGYRGESNRQIQFSDYSKRKSTDVGYRMSFTQHIQSQKEQKVSKNNSQTSDTQQKKRANQHSFTEFHPSKQPNKQTTIDQKSIQELDEEQMQKSGLLLQQQQQQQVRKSVSPNNENAQIIRKMSSMSKSDQQLPSSIVRKSTVNQMKMGDSSIPDIDLTQAQTNQDTQRTSSGRMLTLTERKNDTSPSDRRIQTEYTDQSQFQQPQMQQSQQISNTPQQNKQFKGYKKSETFLANKPKNKYARKSTDALREIQEDQQFGPPSNRGSTRLIESNKTRIPLIKEEDEVSRNSKSRLSSQQSSQSHIRRASTTIQQPIKMAIKVNDENPSEYIAQWKQRTTEQEQQTDIELLTNLLETLISNLGLPQDIQQKIMETMPAIISLKNLNQLSEIQNNLMKKQQSFKNVVQKYGFDTERVSSNQTKNHSAKQSQESLLKHESEEEQIQMGSKLGSQQQVDTQRIQNSKTKSTRFLQEKQKKDSTVQRQPSRQPIDPQEQFDQEEAKQIFNMAAELNIEQVDQMPYEEVVKQIQNQENDGKQLQQIKPNELKGETFLRTLFNQIQNKKTKGVENVQELLRKYYKKGKHENITYYEFKAFYQRLAAIHKTCGQDQMCSHLQRFIMRLGYTCSIFSKRQLLKTNTSVLKPFNTSEDMTTQSKLTNTHQNLAQSRFTSQQFYMSEEQFY